MSDTTQDVKDAAHDVKNDVKDAAHDLKNTVKDVAHDVKNDAMVVICLSEADEILGPPEKLKKRPSNLRFSGAVRAAATAQAGAR